MRWKAKRYRGFRGFTFFWLLIWLSGLSGCTGRKTRPETPVAPPQAPPTVGPPVPTPPPQSSEVFGPPLPPEVKKNPVEKPHVALVLGGAGVASFATVGLLKRFQEEGVQVDSIIATGWPALFAVGYGFLRSVHDLEWFAMRLQEKDFYATGGFFEVNKDYASHDRLSRLIENSFTQHDLAETRIPILISASDNEPGEAELYDKGDWKGPLLKTMSVPGIYRPYPETNDARGGTSSAQGLDVDDAVKRGSKVIVAVEMYDDYFNSLKGRKGTSDAVFRRAYLAQMKSGIAREFKLAQITGRIHLGKAPNDFSAKRLAILQGYKEGARIARELRIASMN